MLSVGKTPTFHTLFGSLWRFAVCLIRKLYLSKPFQTYLLGLLWLLALEWAWCPYIVTWSSSFFLFAKQAPSRKHLQDIMYEIILRYLCNLLTFMDDSPRGDNMRVKWPMCVFYFCVVRTSVGFNQHVWCGRVSVCS